MVGVAEYLFKEKPSLAQFLGIGVAGAHQGLNQPEGAEVECSLGAFQSVRSFVDVIAKDQAVGNQASILGSAIDRVNGLQYARVGGRDKEDHWHHQG